MGDAADDYYDSIMRQQDNAEPLDGDDEEECGCADKAPADGSYWVCPKCGAEWHEEEPAAQQRP